MTPCNLVGICEGFGGAGVTFWLYFLFKNPKRPSYRAQLT